MYFDENFIKYAVFDFLPESRFLVIGFSLGLIFTVHYTNIALQVGLYRLLVSEDLIAMH